MDKSEKVVLFKSCEKISDSKRNRYSYIDNQYGSVAGFQKYISGYVLAAEVLFEKYNSCDRIDILDTIVYPLCFIYRHITELYIKYLYFKYSRANAIDRKMFLKTVSHDLNKAWERAKAFIIILLQKIESPVDTSILDDYISQIAQYDDRSMRMRYPIDQNLSHMHKSSQSLDVEYLHKKIIELIAMFQEIDACIDGVISDNHCKNGFFELISDLYYRSRSEIMLIVEKLKKLSAIEDHRFECQNKIEGLINIADVYNFNDDGLQEFEYLIEKLPCEKAAILAILTHAGQDVYYGNYRLALNKEDHKKDFIKLLEITLKDSAAFISLNGLFKNRDMCYAIIEKNPTLTLAWLETSIEIMNDL